MLMVAPHGEKSGGGLEFFLVNSLISAGTAQLRSEHIGFSPQEDPTSGQSVILASRMPGLALGPVDLSTWKDLRTMK